jgi:hypothetical protein
MKHIRRNKKPRDDRTTKDTGGNTQDDAWPFMMPKKDGLALLAKILSKDLLSDDEYDVHSGLGYLVGFTYAGYDINTELYRNAKEQIQEYQTIIRKRGGGPVVIMGAMKKYEQEEAVQGLGLSVLSSIGVETSPVTSTFLGIHLGAIDWVASILGNENFGRDTRESAIQLLAVLSGGVETNDGQANKNRAIANINYMLELGIISKIIPVYAGSPYVTSLMQNLAQNDECKKELCRQYNDIKQRYRKNAQHQNSFQQFDGLFQVSKHAETSLWAKTDDIWI